MSCCPYLSRVIGLFVGLVFTGGFFIAMSDRPSAADEDANLLRHVVMFQFKATSSEKDVQTVVDAFRKLPSQIPEIHSFEFGVNNSPEGLNEEFTHCFLVTFKSEKDRETYLPHAAHKAFVEVLKPHLEKVMVIDYWSHK